MFILKSCCENEIELSYNQGAAFGILSGHSEAVLFMSLLACFILLIVALKSDNKIIKLGLGLMLGGAISNLSERIIYGYVIDWITILNYLGLDLNFNLADVEISLGVLILISVIFFEKERI